MRVGLRLDAAMAASVIVPETSVDEDNLFQTTKNNIGLSWQILSMEAETIAHPMNHASDV